APPPAQVPSWRPHDLGAFNPPIARSEGWQQLFGLETETPSAPATQETAKPRAVDLEEGVSRSVFQLHGLYIAAQLRTGFMLVDQHRAHERILYERNLRNLESGSGASQAELFPRIVELNANDHSMVEERLPELRSLGLGLELFGGRSVQVNGMPAEAGDEDPSRLIESLLEQLKNEKASLRNERHMTIAR